MPDRDLCFHHPSRSGWEAQHPAAARQRQGAAQHRVPRWRRSRFEGPQPGWRHRPRQRITSHPSDPGRPDFDRHRMGGGPSRPAPARAVKDYWIPMGRAGTRVLFFFRDPIGQSCHGHHPHRRHQRGSAGQPGAQDPPGPGSGPDPGQLAAGPDPAFALAVYLFAPVVVVPLTISTAVGAATLVGERAGTGSGSGPLPASVPEIYLGKLFAGFVPGYADHAGRLACTRWWSTWWWVPTSAAGSSRHLGGGSDAVDHPPFLLLRCRWCLPVGPGAIDRWPSRRRGLITLPMIGIAYSQSTGTLLGGSPNTGWILSDRLGDARRSALHTGVRSVTRARLLGVAR